MLEVLINLFKLLFDLFNSLFGPKESPKPEFEIVDKIDELPKHTTRVWNDRDLSKLKWIVIHQTASNANIQQIAKYHSTPGENNHLSKKGAPGFAYHYAITEGGRIWKTNEDCKLTWNTSKKNSFVIGVLVNGNFSGPNYTGNQDPTLEQKRALRFLLDHLSKKYPSVEIVGHCELTSYKESCPGTILMHEIMEYREL
jgi:N-acetyl-anhydromuramyl-L-alanine amidase AmpD